MKVVLLQHPVSDFYTTGSRTYPLGLCLVAAALEGVCDVEIMDCRTRVKPVVIHEHRYSDVRDYFQADVGGPFSLFRQFYRFGWSAASIRAELERVKPDIVGISCSISTYFDDCLETIRLVKTVNPAIITVVGGLHATLFPEDFLELEQVDYVIRGDGLGPMKYLVQALSSESGRSGIAGAGICFRYGGSFVISEVFYDPDIDKVPAHQLLKAEDYCSFRKSYAFMMSSYGCPLQCKFCGKTARPYRTRSMASLDEELALLAGRQIKVLDIEDDMLNYDLGHFEHLLDRLGRYSFDVYAMNGMFPGNLDRKILERMLVAGFRKVNLSFVSSSKSLLREQGRSQTNNFKALISTIEQMELLLEVHFIIGLPRQKVGDVLETILFLMGTRLLLGPSIYYAVPGSFYWEKGPLPYELCRSSIMYPHHFTRPVLFTFMKLVRFINFCKDLVDRVQESLTIQDLLQSAQYFITERDHNIFNEFCRYGSFTGYHRSKHDFVTEIQDPELIKVFRTMARNQAIKGFKSSRTLLLNW